jgi:hypothetical protein
LRPTAISKPIAANNLPVSADQGRTSESRAPSRRRNRGVGGAALSLLGVNPIRLLVIVAVINGVAAALFLVLVMLISNDQKDHGRLRKRQTAPASLAGEPPPS